MPENSWLFPQMRWQSPAAHSLFRMSCFFIEFPNFLSFPFLVFPLFDHLGCALLRASATNATLPAHLTASVLPSASEINVSVFRNTREAHWNRLFDRFRLLSLLISNPGLLIRTRVDGRDSENVGPRKRLRNVVFLTKIEMYRGNL